LTYVLIFLEKFCKIPGKFPNFSGKFPENFHFFAKKRPYDYYLYMLVLKIKLRHLENTLSFLRGVISNFLPGTSGKTQKKIKKPLVLRIIIFF
jgi:hypothetical protein